MNTPHTRYYSLDVFRGATVALMILVNNPGSWLHIYPPFKHAAWEGCTPTDLVFPFFLFAVGNAMSFVMPRFRERGSAYFWQKVLRRTLLIFAIGLFLNWSPFVKWDGSDLVAKPWEAVRIVGVLQRIALAYFFASVIVYYARSRGAFVIGAVILLVYWMLCWWLGDPADPYSLDGFFGNRIDEAILGARHMLGEKGVVFDPEGLASTLPAIVQVVFGYLVGEYIQAKGKNSEMLSNLLVAGLILAVAGLAWGLVFPINKKIWTSSYVVYTTALAMLTIGVMIFLLEFRNARGGWNRFFDVFGKNPLFIFVLAGFLPRVQGLIRWTDHYGDDGKPVYISPMGWFYQHVCSPLGNAINGDPRLGSFIYAIVIIIFYWLIVYVLDRKKIYIKV
ncbi:MAG TPA: DUF5009 domain-containing protein [Chitinophagaceae bacterium]